MIRKQLLALALAVLSLGSAQASIVNFTGNIESGNLTGQMFAGYFSYDETLVTNSTDFLALTGLEFSFNNRSYSLADAVAGSTTVSFFDGLIVGIDAVYGTDLDGLVLSSGFGDPFLSDTEGNFGTYAVPEPSSLVLGVMGLLALYGGTRRRQRPAS